MRIIYPFTTHLSAMPANKGSTLSYVLMFLFKKPTEILNVSFEKE